MIWKARVQHKVPFHDVDVMYIAWHGHYLKYFELARTALMQRLDLDWPQLKENGIAMPVVEAHAQYRKPILYDQAITIEASLEEYHFAELVIQYRIFPTAACEQIISSGWTRQVYMNSEDKGIYFVVPDFVNRRFAEAEAQRGEA